MYEVFKSRVKAVLDTLVKVKGEPRWTEWACLCPFFFFPGKRQTGLLFLGSMDSAVERLLPGAKNTDSVSHVTHVKCQDGVD